MVEFEKMTGDEIEYGENKFIEVTRKKAVSEEGEKEFIAIVTGYFDDDGKKRYKNNLSIPMEEDVVNFISEKLPEMLRKE